MMKRLAVLVALFAGAPAALAQVYSNPTGTSQGNLITAGQLPAFSGDCVSQAGTSVLSCTKTTSPTIVGTSVVPFYQSPVITTAATTNGSAVITISAGIASSIVNGANVNLSNCASCTTVISGGGTQTLTLDANAISTLGAANVTFGIQRFNVNSSVLANSVGTDSLLVGQASFGNGNWTGIYDGPGRYANAAANASIGNAQIISTNGTRALFLASRMSDNNPGVTGFLGPETYVNQTVIDAPLGGAISAWNEYTETTITSAAGAAVAGSQVIQRESAISSQWAAISTIDPFTSNATGAVINHRYGCGKGFGPTPNNCSTALQLINNGAAFESGFVVGNTALDTTAGRIAPAYSMGPSHSVSWFGSAASQAWKIYSTATTGAHSIMLTDGDMQIGTSTLSLNGAAGDSTRQLNFKSAASLRWNVGVASTAESGGNAGSDFAFANFSDLGGFLKIPFFIQRSTGFVGINQGAASYELDVNGTTRTQRIVYNGAAPTVTTGTCVPTTFAGGTLNGTFVTPLCALATTIILSALPAAPVGYACFATDRTTQTALILESTSTTTSATFKISGVATVNADVVQFSCSAY